LQESQQEPDKLANGKKTNTLQLDDPIIPTCTFIGQLGGSSVGLSGRIKDYTFLELPSDEPSENISSTLLIVTAGSDGTIRIWALEKEELAVEETSEESKSSETQVGRLLGTYETGNRITCLESFILSGSDDNEDGDGVEEDIENSDSEGSDSEVSG
jgi:protein MAK11